MPKTILKYEREKSVSNDFSSSKALLAIYKGQNSTKKKIKFK